jgi:hypothetical protein
MHVSRKISFVYGVAALIFSCSTSNQPSIEADRQEILRLHEAQRHAHFGKDPKAMVDQFASNLISVNRGKINKTANPERDIERFKSYFNSVEFKKWDDVNPPEIRFSDDHTLAYTIVDKLVVLEVKDSVGQPFEESTHFGWVSIYRKQNDGNWKLECIASTNEPELVTKVK